MDTGLTPNPFAGPHPRGGVEATGGYERGVVSALALRAAAEHPQCRSQDAQPVASGVTTVLTFNTIALYCGREGEPSLPSTRTH